MPRYKRTHAADIEFFEILGQERPKYSEIATAEESPMSAPTTGTPISGPNIDSTDEEDTMSPNKRDPARDPKSDAVPNPKPVATPTNLRRDRRTRASKSGESEAVPKERSEDTKAATNEEDTMNPNKTDPTPSENPDPKSNEKSDPTPDEKPDKPDKPKPVNEKPDVVVQDEVESPTAEPDVVVQEEVKSPTAEPEAVVQDEMESPTAEPEPDPTPTTRPRRKRTRAAVAEPSEAAGREQQRSASRPRRSCRTDNSNVSTVKRQKITNLKDHHAKLWDDKFLCMKAYNEKHKNFHPHSGTALGSWAKVQRRRYKNGKLSKDKTDQLNAIGFEWKGAEEYHWHKMYECLKKWKKEHKTAEVPNRTPHLGSWVSVQRKLYLKGELPEERFAPLDAIGFRWQLRDPPPTWMEMYGRLKKYKEEFKDTVVPRTSKIDPQLGSWVAAQRKFCTNIDRIALLNEIDMCWDCNKKANDHWMEMFERLKKYNKKYFTCNVPARWKEDSQLATWVNTQRRRKQPEDKRDLLNSIGFVWEVKRDSDSYWIDMYERLVAYQTKHKTTHVPRGKDPQLGPWVEHQRRRCRDEDRVALLNDINFDWISREAEGTK